MSAVSDVIKEIIGEVCTERQWSVSFSLLDEDPLPEYIYSHFYARLPKGVVIVRNTESIGSRAQILHHWLRIK